MDATTAIYANYAIVAVGAVFSYLFKRCVNRIDEDLKRISTNAADVKIELRNDLVAVRLDFDARVDTVEKDIKNLGVELSRILREEIKTLRDEMNNNRDTTTSRLDTIVQMLAGR